MRRKMLVAMRPEVVDALELLLVEERGVEAREWVDEALLAVGQAKRLYAECVHAPIFVHEGVCKACGKTGLR